MTDDTKAKTVKEIEKKIKYRAQEKIVSSYSKSALGRGYDGEGEFPSLMCSRL